MLFVLSLPLLNTGCQVTQPPKVEALRSDSTILSNTIVPDTIASLPSDTNSFLKADTSKVLPVFAVPNSSEPCYGTGAVILLPETQTIEFKWN